MKIHLAGISTYYEAVKKHHIPYVLESFYYFRNNNSKTAKQICKDIDKFDSFLLDSGAFTFMRNVKKSKIDFDKYTEDYANFINKYNIKYFFELDIDSVVGYTEVKRLREKLESLTGKKCIPVWHRARGKNDWLKTIKEYDYVAVGGIVTKEIKRNEYYIFNWLIDTAKKEGVKVHGLGFTSLELLKKYRFFSVDSTSWLSGSRFNVVYTFEYTKLKANNFINRHRKVDWKTIDSYNCKEWGKFIKYADKKF